MIGFLALSPSIDVTYEVDELVRGGVTRPTRVTRVAGGKALNAARAARAHGATVAVVAALGGHGGRWIALELAREGIPASIVDVVGETRTCVAIADGATSSTDIYEPASALTHDEWTAYAAAAGRLRTGWLAISGSVPAGVPLAGLVATVERLRRAGARVAVDAAGDALRELSRHADLLKVNRTEASGLVGGSASDAAAAAAHLHARTGATAIVTDGIRGGAAVSSEGAIQLAPPARLGRFPAGSGDAFLGALLAALDGSAPLASAIAVGARAAERNAAVPGAGRLAPGSLAETERNAQD